MQVCYKSKQTKNLKYKKSVGINLSLLQKVRKQGIRFWHKRTLKFNPFWHTISVD